MCGQVQIGHGLFATLDLGWVFLGLLVLKKFTKLVGGIIAFERLKAY